MIILRSVQGASSSTADENPYVAPSATNPAHTVCGELRNERDGWPGWVAVIAILLFVSLSVACFFGFFVLVGMPPRY
jgi:hypothetical protein